MSSRSCFLRARSVASRACVLALLVAGAARAGGPGVDTVASTDTGPACNPTELANVGATWTFPGVTCPYGPDAQAIAACQAGGFGAMIDGIGYPTLTEAADAARPGDVIVLCPGVHRDDVTLADVSLIAANPEAGATILAQGATHWLPVRDVTVRGVSIARKRGLSVTGGVQTTMECLNVQDHDSTLNGPIQNVGTGTLTVRNSRFQRVVSMSISGGGGPLVVEDSVFADNTELARSNGSHGVMGGSYVTVRRTAFLGNYQDVSSPTCVGAGKSLRIEDSWFEGNGIGTTGDDTIVRIAFGNLEIVGTTFKGNTTAYGRLVGTPFGEILVSDSTFTGNTTAMTVNGPGGIFSAGTVLVERSRFENNSTVEGAGSVFDVVSRHSWRGADLVVHRNSGGQAALSIPGSSTFECTCCSFGAFGDDNDPLDAVDDGQPIPQLPLNFTL